MGVLHRGERPPISEWPYGTLEFAGPDHAAPRRLVLRAFRSAPGHGALCELIRPELVGITDNAMRLRGIEAFEFGNGTRGAMVQEWLVAVVP